MQKVKLKSFGIIEAVIASGIVVVVLSGALILSSSALRSATLESSYLEAEHIADSAMEQIMLAKTSGKVSFSTFARDQASIDCFDTLLRNQLGCSALGYYSGADISAGYVKVKSANVSSAFPDNFFKYKVTIPDSNNRDCRKFADSDLPKEKCRVVNIDVLWEESSGQKQYHLSQYFSDWEAK